MTWTIGHLKLSAKEQKERKKSEDSQDYSNIDKIQVEFGYATNSQIIFDSDYIVMDIIVPLNITV